MPRDIILTGTGEPFSTEAAAKTALARKDLSGTHEVIEHGTGYAIAAKEAATPAQTAAVAAEDAEPENTNEPAGEKYFWCVLPAKHNPNDSEMIYGCVNGEGHHYAREVEQIIPQRVIESWKHTAKPVYSKKPGFDRKRIGSVAYCTPTVLRPATKAEYQAFKAASLAKRKEELGQLQASQQ